MFKRNVGLNDRVVRIVLGLALIFMAVVYPKVALGWVGLIPLLSGMVGYCPVYHVFKMSTRRDPHKRMTIGWEG